MPYKILLLISLCLYFFAPLEYSYGFCFANFGIFIISIYFIYKKGCPLISFTTFFALTFFFVNFAYPIFIYPINPLFVVQFKYHFSEIYINKGIALCLIAFEAYLIGIQHNRPQIVNCRNYSINIRHYIVIKYVYYIVSLYNFGVIGRQILSHTSYGEANFPFQTASLFVILTAVLLIVNCETNKDLIISNPKQFVFINRTVIILSLLFVLLTLMLGSRENTIALGLLYIYLYTTFVKKINKKFLFIGMIGGMLGLYSVSLLRNDQSVSFQNTASQGSEISPVWNVAKDLIINNRNLYVGMEFTDDPKHGYTLGTHYVPFIFAPLPFIPEFVSRIFFDKAAVEFTSQQMLTNYTRDDLGHGDLDYELGSNCVVDVYMAWGVLGTLFMFYLLGRLIKYSRIKSLINPYYCYIYSVLLSYSIFFCRGGFFGSYRSIAWGVLVIYYIFHHRTNSVLTNEQKCQIRNNC